jgi:hypothetical protein
LLFGKFYRKPIFSGGKKENTRKKKRASEDMVDSSIIPTNPINDTKSAAAPSMKTEEVEPSTDALWST